MARENVGKQAEEAIVSFDRYGGIVYGLLLKATEGNLKMAGDLLVELFCDSFDQAVNKKQSEAATLPELLFRCQDLLQKKNISFDMLQYYLLSRG